MEKEDGILDWLVSRYSNFTDHTNQIGKKSLLRMQLKKRSSSVSKFEWKSLSSTNICIVWSKCTRSQELYGFIHPCCSRLAVNKDCSSQELLSSLWTGPFLHSTELCTVKGVLEQVFVESQDTCYLYAYIGSLSDSTSSLTISLSPGKQSYCIL